MGVAVTQIDANSEGPIQQYNLPTVDTGSDWAFSFWGGDFYLYAYPLPANPSHRANEPPAPDLAPASPPKQQKAPAAVAASVPPRASAREEIHDDAPPREKAHDVGLREEMAALVRLRALAATDPAAAVTLATEYDARYGKDDVFGEEREAIAVIALAESGHGDAARARGEAFLALHPRSPFAARVAARVRAPAP